jgi:hypothetical protein
MSVKSFKTSGVGVDLAPKGLVLINTTSFSGVSSQALTSFASSTYDNYRIMLTVYSNSLTDSTVHMKLRSGVTDNSSALYSTAAFTKTRTNVDSAFAQSDITNGIRMFQLDNGGGADSLSYTSIIIDLFDIFATRHTKVVFSGNFLSNSTLPSVVTGMGLHGVVASYDGVNIISDGATITGSLSVYGYNK